MTRPIAVGDREASGVPSGRSVPSSFPSFVERRPRASPGARSYVGRAERFSQVVLPCHVTSLGLGPSQTSMAIKRSEIIAGIHEELDDIG